MRRSARWRRLCLILQLTLIGWVLLAILAVYTLN